MASSQYGGRCISVGGGVLRLLLKPLLFDRESAVQLHREHDDSLGSVSLISSAAMIFHGRVGFPSSAIGVPLWGRRFVLCIAP